MWLLQTYDFLLTVIIIKLTLFSVTLVTPNFQNKLICLLEKLISKLMTNIPAVGYSTI